MVSRKEGKSGVVYIELWVPFTLDKLLEDE
jgi:hypothetical protein